MGQACCEHVHGVRHTLVTVVCRMLQSCLHVMASESGLHDHINGIQLDELHIPERSTILHNDPPRHSTACCSTATAVRHKRSGRTRISMVSRSSMCM